MAAIHDLGKELTIILIAHRLSTVQNADAIFVFDKGALVAQGNYEVVLETSPLFQQLVSAKS
jgi:ATP-binding cassette subfamily B protein